MVSTGPCQAQPFCEKARRLQQLNVLVYQSQYLWFLYALWYRVLYRSHLNQLLSDI